MLGKIHRWDVRGGGSKVSPGNQPKAPFSEINQISVLEKQMLDKYGVTEDDFHVLEEVVYLKQPFKAGKPWKFAGSFYYATTVLTTIGYGHSTPKTDAGKIFTIVYAMIGIPLGLVMFNSIGERLNNISSIVVNKLRKALKAKQQETTEMDLIMVWIIYGGDELYVCC